jgi:streptogramin lyase
MLSGMLSGLSTGGKAMFKQISVRFAIALLAIAAWGYPRIIQAQDRAGTLQGIVKDASGAPVAGAFVKMKNAERRLTFMVISQAAGQYSVNTLPSGKYVVQGVGGEFQSEMSAPVDVAAGRPASLDLSLTTKRAPQLPPAWPGRQPGERGAEAERATRAVPSFPEGEGKKISEAKCLTCHDAARIVRVRVDKNRWEEIILNMRLYARGSNFAKDLTDQEAKILADYFSTHYSARDRVARPKADPNSRLPRTLVKGEATKYMVVEYDLPDPTAEPHEITADSEGNGWVSQRRGGKLGRLDGKTLVYTEVAPPPGESKLMRLNGITYDAKDKLWMVDGGPNRRFLSYDTRAKEFGVYNLPKLKNGNASGNSMRVHPNGTVWLNSIGSNQIIRLDPRTKQFTVFEAPAGVKRGTTASPYGLAISGDSKVWVIENAVDQMARIDPVSGKIEEFPIPVNDPVARKGGMDSEGNVWVGLHGAGHVMKIDYKTTQMTVYTPPTTDSGPYSVQGDPKSKLVWFSQQHVDKIAKFDPTTETFTEYPLPYAESDTRRIEVDRVNPKRIWYSGMTSGKMGFIEVVN